MDSIERLRQAFDDGDLTACDGLLVDHPEHVDRVARDGLAFLLSALHRESHGTAAGLSELFLRHGAALDVHMAAAMGDRGTVGAFLEENPSRLTRDDVWGMQPLHWAAHCGHSDLVDMLLDAGAPIDQAADSWTALHLAVELSHPETVRLLIARGANVFERLDAGHESMTPLEMAEAWDLPEMAVLLRPYYETDG